jgi:hypothetical protein
MDYWSTDNTNHYYICYANKDNKFIYKQIDKNKHCFLLEDFVPDNAEYFSINKNIPEYFHKSILQMMYKQSKVFSKKNEHEQG